MADFSSEFSSEFDIGSGAPAPVDLVAQALVKNARRGVRTINATAFGIRRIAVPHTLRRRYRYPVSIIPPQRLNIYKESIPDVYAPTDVFSTGTDSGPEILAPSRTITDPVTAPPVTVGGTDIEAILLMALDL